MARAGRAAQAARESCPPRSPHFVSSPMTGGSGGSTASPSVKGSLWNRCPLSIAPRLAQAAAWTVEPGVLWTKPGITRLSSDRIFATPVDEARLGCGQTITRGDRVPYDCTTGGRFMASTVTLEAALGLHDRFDLRVQVPIVIESSFANDAFEGDSERGLGDVRVGGHIG